MLSWKNASKFLANFTSTNEEIDFVRDSLPGCEVNKQRLQLFFITMGLTGLVILESRNLSVIILEGLIVPTLKCRLSHKDLLCSLKCLYSGSKVMVL